MNWEFDWISNPKVTLNLVINVLVGGLAGCALAYWAAPAGTVFLSKTVMSAGFAPAVIAFVAKMQKSPQEQHTEDRTKLIQNGQASGRRAADDQGGVPDA